MGETLDARIAFLQRQLHNISLAIHQARARGDTQALDTLATLWAKVAADVEQLKRDALKEDAPSAFMQSLAGIGDEVVRVAGELRDAGITVVRGTATLVKWLPVILLVALVAVGLIYAGKIRKGLGE